MRERMNVAHGVAEAMASAEDPPADRMGEAIVDGIKIYWLNKGSTGPKNLTACLRAVIAKAEQDVEHFEATGQIESVEPLRARIIGMDLTKTPEELQAEGQEKGEG